MYQKKKKIERRSKTILKNCLNEEVMTELRAKSGIIIIDKHEGITSARIVSKIKRILGVKKVGHAGTLDPFASGVLICCINQGTKLARYFLKGTKTYEAVMFLGAETDTQDLTGKIVGEYPEIQYDINTIKKVFENFRGEYRQFPPLISALKHKGTPLYKLARKGNSVQKPARLVNIYFIEILDICIPEIYFRVQCSAGTYIRTLCSDIGKALNSGAYLKSLVRTESSLFTKKEAVSLFELEQLAKTGKWMDVLIPMEKALRDTQSFNADDILIKKIKFGNKINLQDIPFFNNQNKEILRIMDKCSRLIAVISKEEKDEEINVLRLPAL